MVSTTAMGDKGGSSCQIHAREGNGRGSGRPRRQIATRGPRDATPPSSPGPPAATAPARSGRRTRALGGGGRPDGDPRGDDAHLGSSPVHPCLRSVLAPRRVRSVHRPRLRAAGEDLEVSPVSDRTFESIDRRLRHISEMKPTDLHTWSSTKAPPSTSAPAKPTPARRKRRQAQTARTASARSLPTSRAPSSRPSNPARSTRAPPRRHRPSRDNDVGSRAKPREPRRPRARDDRAPPRPSRRGIRHPRGEERRRPPQVRAEFPIRPNRVAFPAPDRSSRPMPLT